jgi:hypothetical protein
MNLTKDFQKFNVCIYCKIYTDSFEILDGEVTGDDLYNYLTRDSGHAFNEGIQQQGDPNIWYLGCNEKFGEILYKNTFYKEWGHGESSFDNVEAFVEAVNDDGFFTVHQYQYLIMLIEEGREIDCMYDFGKYLDAKSNGMPWKLTETAKMFRGNFKKQIESVKKHFENKGYRIINPGD